MNKTKICVLFCTSFVLLPWKHEKISFIPVFTHDKMYNFILSRKNRKFSINLERSIKSYLHLPRSCNCSRFSCITDVHRLQETHVSLLISLMSLYDSLNQVFKLIIVFYRFYLLIVYLKCIQFLIFLQIWFQIERENRQSNRKKILSEKDRSNLKKTPIQLEELIGQYVIITDTQIKWCHVFYIL